MDEDQEFERILLDHGFVLVRTRGSHKQFKGVADGVTRLATLDYSQPGEDILPRNLRSMIHQSGLRAIVPQTLTMSAGRPGPVISACADIW